MLIRSQEESHLRRFMGKTSILYNVGHCRQFKGDMSIRLETGGWKHNKPNRRILRTKEVSTSDYVEVKCD